MRAEKYLERLFKANKDIIIRTFKSDKYDRYLSDIFYLTEEKDMNKIARNGIFLNQELLDKGVVWKW